MSPEAWIGLASLVLTGLCAMMWGTDGRLDWIAEYAGLAVALCIPLACAYNYGIQVASSRALTIILKLKSYEVDAALGQIKADAIPPQALLAMSVGSVALYLMPRLFRQIREART